MAETFRIWRIFTGPDGKSRQEALDVPLQSAKSGLVSKLFSGPGVEIHHNAPKRQLIATLSGEAQIETGDGKVLNSRAGVIHLVEDVTGQGHITRVVGSEDRVSLFMPLDDSTLLA